MKGHSFQLETMKAEYAEAYIEMHKCINTENPYMIRPAGEYEVPAQKIREEAKALKDNPLKYWKVLIVDGELAGHIRVSRSSKERLVHKAELTVGIKSRYQGNGFSNILMEDCINWCKESGVERFDLHVATVNKRAIALYSKFGFKEVGLLKKDIKINDDVYYDTLFMSKFL